MVNREWLPGDAFLVMDLREWPTPPHPATVERPVHPERAMVGCACADKPAQPAN